MTNNLSDFMNLSGEDFIKGIADGRFHTNDAVKYCSNLFDKEDFLSLLYVCTYTDYDHGIESERVFSAAEAVYSYLVSIGMNLKRDYGFIFDPDSAALQHLRDDIYDYLDSKNDPLIGLISEMEAENGDVGTSTDIGESGRGCDVVSAEMRAENGYVGIFSNVDDSGRGCDAVLPSEFDTEKGRRIFDSARDSGWLDNSYKPTVGVSRSEMSIFAHLLGKRLDVSNHFAVMERFWGVRNLPQAYYKAIRQKRYEVLRKKIQTFFK